MNDKYDKTAISLGIKEVLTREGMSLRDLELSSGVPYGTLKCINEGRTVNPGVYTVRDIAEGLNCTLAEFMEICGQYGGPREDE